ncbi:MAG: hypothetical protein M3126_06960 [Candidatus Eremiobacteraeota bacterium]|nr:hypothetical protein [Candidatus Eremiobacteraeota bacterium]
MKRLRAGLFLFVFAFISAGFSRGDAAPAVSAKMYDGMHWRLAGPFRGGRTVAVTGIPGNATTFYFGSVGGGVWKTIDAGQTWKPVFDSQPVASIGAVAVAPSDPNVVYVGSGEADMRDNIQHGNGMYKSVDAGAHWTHAGLTGTRQIGKIVVDPKNPNRVFAAALGHAYGPNPERGVFRSEDGGTTWSKVLYKDADTGAIDLAMDPANSNVLYASLWQTRRPPWSVYPPSNGPGSGLYKSIDGGTTWNQLSSGLPAGILGHIGVAVSPSNSQRVYAIVDADKGGLYASDDGGASWKLRDSDSRIWGRGWYFEKVSVDPKNADTVYVSNTCFYRSTNGGTDFTAIKGAPGGDDYQGVWIDPTDGSRMILASDQGAVVSLNGAQTWSSWYNQPTAQFYHVATDNQFPYWIYGAQQDSGAIGTPSRTNYLGIWTRDWRPIAAGGESGYVAPDPEDARVLFGTTVEAFDQLTGQDRAISPELLHPGVYRHTWTLPVVFSKQKPHVLYYGSQVLFRSADKGKSWTIASPDLTRPRPGIPANLDAYTAKDNSAGPRPGVIYTIAPSPLTRGMIWTGTDDGKIQLTRDEGKHWRDVTPPALTPWSKVSLIEASAHAVGTAYAAVLRNRLEDDRPYIYRTRDGGRTWVNVVRGIPDGDFVHVVREDPLTPNLLYAGTEHGVFVSFNGGDGWQPLQLNLPNASVRDISARNDDLVIATHGRAFWVLDNVAPLRELAAAQLTAVHLFKPATAVRIADLNDQGTPLPLETAQGENPKSGAMLDYYLESDATGVVSLEVRDPKGRTVRRYASTDKPKIIDPKSVDIAPAWFAKPVVLSGTQGMHRFLWDFHYAGADAEGTGPLAPPGNYTIRLAANGRTYSQPLLLRKDPRVRASNADLQAQYALAAQVVPLQVQAKKAFAAATALLKATKDPAKRKAIEAIAGGPPVSARGDFGASETGLGTLHFIQSALGDLQAQIESADAAPTPDMHRAYSLYKGKLAAALARWNALRK